MGEAQRSVAAAYASIAAADNNGVFIELVEQAGALARARQVDDALAAGATLPLAGKTVAVKGNIDVAEHRTTAGCPAYGHVATRSASAVRALEAAGAIVVAITNLDQFATGLVGTRSPYGICPNARWSPLIAGGSSSGSAVAVARGLVDLGIGTDTAGSGRVPAAANGIVGLKPTRGLVSTRGVVPACRSFDCVSVFARDVSEAAAATAVMAAFDPDDPWSRAAPAGSEQSPDDRPLRIGLPFSIAVPGSDALLASTEADCVDIDIDPFLDAGSLLYGGAFVAERYAAVGGFIESHRDEVDPIVAETILASRSLPAWQLARDRDELARLRRMTETCWSKIDVLALPTVPRIPTIAEVLAAPVARNDELGLYTNFVNLLDLCAITMPIGAPTPDAPPPSVSLIAPAWSESLLVDVARMVERQSEAR